jgi:uncharacterized membrane protein YhaH (DUF805 family)
MQVSTQMVTMSVSLAMSHVVHARQPETLLVVLALQDTILSGWVSLVNSIATMESMEIHSLICVFCVIIHA